MKNHSKAPDLPLSLKQKRAREITMRIICCILLLLLFIFIIITWGNRLFPTTLKSRMGYTGLRIMFYILLLSIPFLVTGIPLKLIDRSWCGTISSVTIEENLRASGGGRPKLHRDYDLVLSIKTDDGKNIEKTILSFNSRDPATRSGKIHHQEHKINVGDRVYKYYGFKHLYIVPQKYCEHKNCIVCGSKNKYDQKRCWYCDAEILIDINKE